MRIAVYSAIVLTLITLAIMLQVVALSELGNRRARRRKTFNESWRPFLALCSISDGLPSAPPKLARRDRLWWVLQWNRLQQHLRGTARERMNAALDALGMGPYVLELLRGGVRKRLIALTCLRYFGSLRHWDAIAALLDHRNAILALAAAQTLIAIDATRAMEVVLPIALKRQDWALPRLAALCQYAEPAAVTPALLATMYAADEPQRHRLASLMTFAEPRLTGPWARLQLDSEAAADLLQTALRCLGAINDPRDRTRILAQFDHTDANVRLVAVQTFRYQADPDDAEWLIGMLTDLSWWVRQAAADAVASLPGYSDAKLLELAETFPDRYGQDALRRVIAERRE
ncbi:hypothetical protein SAMN05216421_1236 [Halopseudomonas xinjiangensis]|uniref:HEAT repeat domain-containing protein n=1 Tax=Halopseudomonas xinjiangensis TaxID=487184 RepID=A0A1H1QXZ3_9GAMM|nr:hypothetical protein SAMN05216421_1236 [Halopseudomonas xinjiangensis]